MSGNQESERVKWVIELSDVQERVLGLQRGREGRRTVAPHFMAFIDLIEGVGDVDRPGARRTYSYSHEK